MDAPGDDSRLTLEQAMKEMVDRMGVVHLGPVLDILGEQLGKLKEFLRKPRSLVRILMALCINSRRLSDTS